MQPHKIASREDWLAARKWLLGKERELTHLRDQLRGLQPVRSKLHGISSLLQNSADEFADADRVVRNDHDFFRGGFIHRGGGNTAGSDGQGSGSENASRVGRGHDNVHFRGGRAGQTVHIHQQDQTSIGGYRRSGEELDAAQARGLPEPVPSVTEHTTRAFEPVYNERTSK